MNVNFFNTMPLKVKDNFFDNNINENLKSENNENSKFNTILKDMFNQANQLKIDSDNMTSDFLAGKTDNLHEVMITAQKADIAISFVSEIRNRLVEAYQEFSRMQL